MEADVKGCIFSIQHFSIQDGPGIRTTLFLKGCPLHCLWCHNPESISFRPEIAFYEEFCIGCGRCFEVCPNHCHQLVENGRTFRRELCTGCGLCAEECCAEALELKGKKYSVLEALQEVEQDRPFYEQSGGGMTLSGGEPLAQPQFCREILKHAKNRGIHTVVDTSGYANWNVLESILAWTDLFLFDLKADDAQLHRRLTGVENTRIKSNLEKLLTTGAAVIVRIPLIPGCNDQPAEMEGLADMISKLHPSIPVNILPYHQFAEQKYHRIGKEYRLKGVNPLSLDQLRPLGRIFEEQGVTVTIKGIERMKDE